MKPENQSVRRVPLAGRVVTLTTYQLGDTWHCTADNTDPGARLARTEAKSREGAESRALAEAEALLTGKRMAPPTGCSG